MRFDLLPSPVAPLLLALIAIQDAVPVTAQDADQQLIEERYFATCDHDANGWVSYAEARLSLETTRAEFKVYDTDWDGRITAEEFHERYLAVTEITGVFPEPEPGEELTRAISRTPNQLRTAYDKDADNALDKNELREVLHDYGREELSSELVLIKLDHDENSKLESEELNNLSRLLAGPRIDWVTDPAETPKSVEELFGQPIPREDTVDATPLPPRIQGPVSPFRRLDLDADGFISLGDLRGLQSPLQLKARVSAVLATLDVDEDGVISRAEFYASISTPPRQHDKKPEPPR